MITVHVHDLRVFGHHGVYDEERQRGQEFVFDIDLDVGDRGVTDSLESAVDYVKVAATVKDVSDGRQFQLLEALVSAVADELERLYAPERVRVTVRKPDVKPAGLDGTVGVTVTRPSGRYQVPVYEDVTHS
jgi:dihydroneopterin aldolase